MAMLRHRRNAGSNVDARLLVSARHREDLLYRDELEALAAADPTLSITYTLTRGAPEMWKGYTRRVDLDMLKTIGPGAAAMPRAFVCGPTPFVEAVADALVSLGHTAAAIHTERFGPTGS